MRSVWQEDWSKLNETQAGMIRDAMVKAIEQQLEYLFICAFVGYYMECMRQTPHGLWHDINKFWESQVELSHSWKHFRHSRVCMEVGQEMVAAYALYIGLDRGAPATVVLEKLMEA